MTQYFKQTSDFPYDRHKYKLYYTSGETKVFDDYEKVQLTWFQTPHQFLNYVEVLDKKSKKKGFG